jgi:hypothetical protein
MTNIEISMASAIVHLLEYIETGHPSDLFAARGALSLPDVEARFNEMQKAALLPLRRDGKPPLSAPLP